MQRKHKRSVFWEEYCFKKATEFRSSTLIMPLNGNPHNFFTMNHNVNLE